ncbi:uncharacterized protein GGS25DRAFT_87734 [Hypoxylon fragiforme]|uniref:uncharacterized protein n=1 Tax=Hypoxylon fragiforme TaxID=63214 RepID=UPI0020C617D2|nr:uncharacterized protein GGS25DRAFT_87734 [Hypoxylon fragiforme]KAI2603300.1 hypothetical protein GGS25DRAFT_87734 [Hypoxylon fragiforme]
MYNTYVVALCTMLVMDILCRAQRPVAWLTASSHATGAYNCADLYIHTYIPTSTKLPGHMTMYTQTQLISCNHLIYLEQGHNR